MTYKHDCKESDKRGLAQVFTEHAVMYADKVKMGAVCLCSNCSGCKAACHETPTLLNGRQSAASVPVAEGATEIV